MKLKKYPATIMRWLLWASLPLLWTPSFAQKTPPSSVAHLYSKAKDMRVSDDFNEMDWRSKWTWREKMGGQDQISIVKTKTDTFVCIKADATTKKGSGICTLNSTKYGFYVSRWRMQGVYPNTRCNWHPSIWASCYNFGVNQRDTQPRPYQRMELDLMEGYGHPSWGVHFITWTGGGSRLYGLKRNSRNFPEDWCTIGMEYTPDYIAAWQYVDGAWKHIKTIPFLEERNSSAGPNYRHHERVYWILSNIFINMNAENPIDSEFQVDYFYHYPYQYDESRQAGGLNYAPVKGTADEVQVMPKTGGYKGKVQVPAQVRIAGKEYRVTAIGDEAFRDCTQLTDVELPAGLKSIGYRAFGNTALVNNSKDTLIYSGPYLLEHRFPLPQHIVVKPGTQVMADGIFVNSRELKTVVLPESMKVLPTSAFEGCVALDSVQLSPALTHIGRMAFTDCAALKKITPMPLLQVIGDRAFDGCKQLPNISLTASISEFGERAFAGCNNFSAVEMTAQKPPVVRGSYAKVHFPDNVELQVPQGSYAAYKKAPFWCDFPKILDVDMMAETYKVTIRRQLKSILDHLKIFAQTKTIGDCRVDGQQDYAAALAAVDAVKCATVKETKAALNAIVQNFKSQLAAQSQYPEAGKYYKIESTGYFDSDQIAVCEIDDRPGWKIVKSNEPVALWQILPEGKNYHLQSANTQRQVGPFSMESASKMTEEGEGASFILGATAKSDEFLLQSEGKGTLKTWTAALFPKRFPKRDAMAGVNLCHQENTDVTAFPVGWKIRQVDSVDLVIDEGKYTTATYPFAVDLSSLGDIHTFTVSQQTDAYAILEAYAQHLLPAGTPVIFQHATPITVPLAISATEAVPAAHNLLRGSLCLTNATTDFYKLAYDAPTATTSFVCSKAGQRIQPNTGYLDCPETGTPSETLALSVGIPEGIEDVTASFPDAIWYTLSGQRVVRPTKGIFVNSHGKTVLFK